MAKILLVDDEKIQREIYDEVFANAKFEVVNASDGLEGLEKYKSEHPDIVFTGIMMPGMDGFTLIEKIRELNPNQLVAIFSHLGRDEDRQKAKERNILFMVKGLDTPKEILEQIQGILAPKNHPETITLTFKD